MSEKFFLTTPIYYVNARPHIGHAYTTIVADVLARRARAQGKDTFFLTGTDEHGQKIERSASAKGMPPQQFADEVSAAFRTLWDRMGLTYDRFIRTTSPEHKRGVQKLFQTLVDRGEIYLSSYTGSYCVSDEAFVDLPAGAPCPDCGRPLETVTEENYFFKLSKYQQPLLDLIVSDRLLIQPFSRRNEVLQFLAGDYSRFINEYFDQHPGDLRKIPSDTLAATEWCIEKGYMGRSEEGFLYVPGALRDLSISRTSFQWGIPVPGNEEHVIYVWLDALANYMTALGYGSDSPEDLARFDKYWPADLHIVGKEIIRFHCVYWPAFLLAANLPLPKQVVAHGWLLFEESKMSKSKGNIVRTETILDAFGPLCPEPADLDSLSFHSETERVSFLALSEEARRKYHQDLFAADVLRYFLLREIPFGQDGSFSFDALVTRYNADLANGYGNLVSRTLSMIAKYFNGEIPTPITSHEPPQGVRSLPLFAKRLDALDFSRALDGVWSGAIGFVDQAISTFKPWEVATRGTDTDRLALGNFLYSVAESIRWITALLYPILPFATASVWRQLGRGDIEQAAANGELTNLQWGGLKPGTKLGPLAPIFPRADVSPDKGLARIMTDMESPKPSPDQATPDQPIECVTSPADPPLAAITEHHDATHPATDDLPVAPVASEPAQHDPAAGPRTATLTEPNPGAQVGGSASPTPVLPTTGTHTEVPGSGIFAHPPADASPQITIDDFAKVELRVAQVLVCERIPKADKLLRLEVDLGYEKRQILSGIAEWYTPEELLGRRIVVITNLAPRKMRGFESHGMLLAASTEGGKPHLATFADADSLPLGSRLK
jgi:methionyl-tRNA synthetase